MWYIMRHGRWLGYPFGMLEVVATYNLIYNAAVFVEAIRQGQAGRRECRFS